MLHLASENESDDEREPPSSPIRRLTQPYFGNASSRAASRSTSTTFSERGSGGGLQGEEVDVVTSTSIRTDQNGGVHGIKKEAFSPNYFEKFFTAEKELGRGGKGVVLLVRHELDGVFLGMPAPRCYVLYCKFHAFMPRTVTSAMANHRQGTLLVNACQWEMTMLGLKRSLLRCSCCSNSHIQISSHIATFGSKMPN